ncbi:hypothetical protein IFT79_13390 [Frigoribacterium sp. CFBP 8759]|uniref:hypothetical protein n=1 Tax=Frigoribacterium sp. CFBP 8759 TaxID=2775283 RepID=UPI00177DC90A|nr:hypothetical protein [Frigoribacterium sp. CFBP 8759]MBD8486612.1 hypothetical protein [Frigoribacterium sp. CFBP 8759]
MDDTSRRVTRRLIGKISGIPTISLLDNKMDHFDGDELVGSASWSPDGSRLLVASSPGAYPQVLDTQNGSQARLDMVIEDPRNTPWLTLMGGSTMRISLPTATWDRGCTS